MFVAVVSDKPKQREEFCSLLGKETGKEDISFYAVNFQGRIITLVEPTLYPDKVQPLLYSLSIADYVVVLVNELNKSVGEIIVALDSMGMDKGLLVSSVELPVAGTVLEKYEKVDDQNAAKEKVLALVEQEAGEETVALVDKTFAVKSVGNVALGVVKSGQIKKHDKLMLLPEKKQMEIRTIQINDKDSEVAKTGERFGIAYKGDLLERGVLVPLTNDFQVEKVAQGRFTKSKFYTDEIKGKMHAYSNFQFNECTVSDNDLKLDKEMAFEKRDSVLLIDASNQKLRIAGVFQTI
jgi:selenocysteine-specific translation elongation factor